MKMKICILKRMTKADLIIIKKKREADLVFVDYIPSNLACSCYFLFSKCTTRH